MTSFNSDYLLKDPGFPNAVLLRIRASTYEAGDTVQSVMMVKTGIHELCSLLRMGLYRRLPAPPSCCTNPIPVGPFRYLSFKDTAAVLSCLETVSCSGCKLTHPAFGNLSGQAQGHPLLWGQI